jgi:hypothetical protein
MTRVHWSRLWSDSIVEVWIFEIELSFSWPKIRLWAHYEITYETECDADARVAVFTPRPALRERIRTKLLARMKKTKPILIEPDQIERISDYAQARLRPELAILGALFHAQDPAPFEAQVEVLCAAWVAMQSLAQETALRYSVAVMSIVAQDVIEQGIAQLRATGELDEDRWELVSESDRDGYSFNRGRDEGRVEGRVEGWEAGRVEGWEAGRCDLLRSTVIDALELRGFAVTPEQRERVASCESLAALERWYAAARVAAANTTVDELLG